MAVVPLPNSQENPIAVIKCREFITFLNLKTRKYTQLIKSVIVSDMLRCCNLEVENDVQTISVYSLECTRINGSINSAVTKYQIDKAALLNLLA